MPLLLCLLSLAYLEGLALAVHIADNGDGTFTNPVMPNAHWSDPSVLRHGSEYFVVTSSIETTPSLQILRSTDLVNFDVIGSVSRHWYTHTIDGAPLQKRQCWSPRLSSVGGAFRVMWHQSGHFMVAEAAHPRGPWALVHHNLTGMAQPSPQWAATVFIDGGATYVYAFNWIRQTDAAALNWVGERHVVADMHRPGVGLMENPSLMKRGDFYYWHESVNGTVTWGLAPDPNAGPTSSNKGALAVWRSRAITGPWEGPRDLIKSNVESACVNTGTVTLGPDNTTWYYLYDAIQPSRWNMQRQMYVDRISWGADGWPTPRTPGRRNRMPAGGVSPPQSTRWIPDLSDEFEGRELEGVTAGPLGRKWLFKEENTSLWALSGDGALALRTSGRPGIESPFPANMLLQRPTSAYFRLETHLVWPRLVAPSSSGGVRCAEPNATAGLIARELNTGAGIAVGLQCNCTTRTLQLAVWQDTLHTLHLLDVPDVGGPGGGGGDGAGYSVKLRIDVELVLAQVWFSVGDGKGWQAVPPFQPSNRGSELTFEYASTYMSWQAVGPDAAAWKFVRKQAPSDAFTTLHPGLFAGGGDVIGHTVRFEYFRFTDNEVFPEDEV